jgi:hypothetical protein
MKTQQGWPFDAASFINSLKKVADLAFFDGPILSHYKSKSLNKNYLISWIDYDEQFNRWLALEVTVPHLYDYLTDAKSLFSIVNESYNSKLFIFSTDTEGASANGLLVSADELIANYQPDEDSYFESVMPAGYTAFFAENTPVKYAERLFLLRAKKVSFRLKPIEDTYATTVGANDIGGFLQKVTRSFKSYLAFRFEKIVKPTIDSVEYAGQVLQKLLEFAEPRAVFAGYNSFEIDLALDVLPLGIADVEVKFVEWQKNTLQEFKHDVFDFDFTAERLSDNLAGASEEQMRSMLLPIVQIATNKNYVVEARDSQESDFKTLQRVTRSQANRVVPQAKSNEEELLVPTKLVNFLLELTEGQDITDMSKSEIRKALISVREADSSTVSGFTSAEGQVVEFRQPIEVNLSRIDNFYQADYEQLGISTVGATGQAAMNGFRRELNRLYSQYLQNIEDRKEGREGLRSARMGQILDEFGELLN